MTHAEILRWLREEDGQRLEGLYGQADRVRRNHVGDAVHLRGLAEISNHCVRECHYCGLRAPNATLARYRMTAEEILACADQAVALGYGTLVMQAGEDYGIEAAALAEIVRRIKARTPLAVTLSLGERPDEDLALWRHAGADRYLLRFETSNAALYERIHPPLGNANLPIGDDGGANQEIGVPKQDAPATRDRFAILRRLRELGYEIGSGVMIGIPGQTYAGLAADIVKFAELDLEMIGVGPFLPHPETPLGNCGSRIADCGLNGASIRDQVPNSEQMAYKVLALARVLCPEANIPATTALATINRATGRELGLMRGANVVMPNLTPLKYRAMYEIYPAKACIRETARDCNACLTGRIHSIGRTIGVGRGDSPRRLRRT